MGDNSAICAITRAFHRIEIAGDYVAAMRRVIDFSDVRISLAWIHLATTLPIAAPDVADWVGIALNIIDRFPARTGGRSYPILVGISTLYPQIPIFGGR